LILESGRIESSPMSTAQQNLIRDSGEAFPRPFYNLIRGFEEAFHQTLIQLVVSIEELSQELIPLVDT
jgi:hypothetical protein